MQSTSDVVFTFATDTWADAVRRGHYMPADQLVLTLSASDLVHRLIVADPWRSAPVRAVRRLQGQAQAPLPGSRHPQRHLTPLRLRRRDPVGLEALRRTYERYDARLARAATRMGLQRPAVITGNPFVAAFSPLVWAGPVTLYLWDNWAAYPPVRPWWACYEAAYSEVAASGRRLVTVSDSLIDRVAPVGPAAVVPNGISPDQWQPPWHVPEWFSHLPSPRFLYIGTLDDRLDLDALAEVAKRWPEGRLVLVGPQPDPSAIASLEHFPNIIIRRPVGRSEIAGLVSASDVCLLPHRSTSLTRAMSPLKLYEYLAGGTRVVATDLPPVRGVDPSVIRVAPQDSFSDAVELALSRPSRTEEERIRFVSANSWASRHERLLDLALAP